MICGRNRSRGPEPSCAESDDSRVDFYANRQLREDYNWDRSRAYYANRVQFLPDGESPGVRSFRDRSPLQSPFADRRYYDPRHDSRYRGSELNPPVYYSSPAYDQASAFGTHFECDYDPRSYPTHDELEQEERYRGFSLVEGVLGCE